MIGSSSSKVQLLRRRARRKSDKILFVGWDDTKSSHFCVHLSSFHPHIEFFHPKAQVFCLKTQFPQKTQRTSNILNALANQLFIRCLYYIRYKFFSMR